MKALLDTNIIIHRESNRILNRDIGILFKWLDKGKYAKYIHPITIAELCKNSNKETLDVISVKLESYQTLKTIAPLAEEVVAVASQYDSTPNDDNDTILLNEVFSDRVDLLISEDKKIHYKAKLLNISEKIFTPEAPNRNEKYVAKSPFITYFIEQ